MDVMKIVLHLTVIIGIICTIDSFTLSGYFSRSKTPLGKDMTHMLFAEGFMNLIVTTFALLALLDKLKYLPIEVATALRLIAFCFAVTSSIRLSYRIVNILKN